MKKELLLFAVSVLPFANLLAQSEPLIEEGKQWSIHSICESYCDDYLEQTTINLLQGDVTFNDILYKQLHVARNEDLSDLKPLQSYLREEGNKIYQYNPTENSERVIYDFNLQKGDRIKKQYDPNISPVVFEVTSVKDTILAGGNGEKRKCIFLDWIGFEDNIWEKNELESNAFDIWVEGVGSLYSGIGEIYAGATGGSQTSVLCCHNGSTPLFVNDKYNTCYRLITTGIEVNNKLPYTILHNPIENKILSIDTGDNKFNQIDLYSLVGTLVLSQHIAFDASPLDISLKEVDSGSYLFVLTKDNGDRESGKIVIK